MSADGLPAMTRFSRGSGGALLIGTVVALVPLVADAQAPRGCAPQQVADGNLVVHCRRVTIEIERGADARLIDRDRDGQPEGATLTSGAIYIDDQSAPRHGAFQVLTPDAIASVRGTSWAVDVGAAQSSVFVVAGAVDVRRRADRQHVVLGAGEGVDVTADTVPLTVKRWAAPRVRALLGRFGR